MSNKTETSKGLAQQFPCSLPTPVLNVLGCKGCEWRSTKKCPAFTGEETVLPQENICGVRTDWLIGFLPIYDKLPSVDRLLLDLSKGLQGRRERMEFSEVERLEKEIIVLDAQRDFIAADGLRDRLAAQKQEFLKVSDLVCKLRDRQIERDTPKKLEVDVTRTIPLSQIHEIMSDGYVVEDADFEEDVVKDE